MRLRAGAAQAVDPETSVIFVWLPGGPPHMEMYDMKPDAPADYRGAFHPIRTNVDGLDVCELMPRHARIADRYNIVRSIAHNFADHGGGHKRFLTGRDPKTPTGFVNDAPAVGSIVARCREHVHAGVPNYISGTDAGRAGVDVYSFGAAYLGPAYVPFNIPGDPTDYTPEISYSLSGHYAFDWSETVPGYVRVDYSYRDAVPYVDRSSFPDENLPQYSDELSLVNLRVGAEVGDFDLEAYVLNATDENKAIDPYTAWSNANRTRPRTIGVSLRYTY